MMVWTLTVRYYCDQTDTHRVFLQKKLKAHFIRIIYSQLNKTPKFARPSPKFLLCVDLKYGLDRVNFGSIAGFMLFFKKIDLMSLSTIWIMEVNLVYDQWSLYVIIDHNPISLTSNLYWPQTASKIKV